MKSNKVLISGIRVSVDSDEDTILKKAQEKMKRTGISSSTLHFRLYKKSIDARRRDDIRFECTVLAEGERLTSLSKERLSAVDAKHLEEEEMILNCGTQTLEASPMIVGMGPAGLFAALLLARQGYAPILIDRGGSVDERAEDVRRFAETGCLNTESNIQFGAGGAGTFSDGKLITRISDPRCSFVLNTLVNFGAPSEVLYKAKPHIGTDLLRQVVSKILEEIKNLGGSVLYHCRMTAVDELSDGTLKINTTKGIFRCGALILAPGHSARDTYTYLIKNNFAIEAKPISVGVRVEHLQQDIDDALYGRFAGHPNLGPAEYALSDTRGERGVYTFCMCPGGEVVAAASEEGHLVVNGMSYHARDLSNANSAVAVSVTPTDFEAIDGSLALGAIAFQRKIERMAFLSGGGDYYAPIMTMGDFLSETRGTSPSRILPSYRGGKVTLADFDEIFPSYVAKSLRYGLSSFGKKLGGYDVKDAILTAAETRTSAPIRILRDREAMTAIGHSRIYPAGEGAGYAGGITSAAVDGIRVAQALMERFAPLKKV
ncbi:MAG: hypothetical protein E7643_09320 [Ruminococcaceae bacterium]|nr:hypothetical protein [Oscillospiraceae bacterium]